MADYDLAAKLLQDHFTAMVAHETSAFGADTRGAIHA